jgi:hypothetical protein
MFSALEDHELSGLVFEKCIALFYQMVTRHLERQMEQGVFRKMDPLLVARSFVGMIAHHGNVFAIHAPGTLQGTPDEVIDTVVEMFLHGMTK